MKSRSNRTLLLATAGAVVASTASAQTVLISDDFEVNTSADYTVVNDGTPDGTQTFAYDYVAANIPLAPRSAAGTTGGLRLTTNDTAGATDVWTLFHTTPVAAQHYKLTVDVWMNFALLTGSTEFAHIGVGGDGVTFNSIFTPISGTGAFFSFSGDGGSSSDYRWFRDAANTPPGDTFSTTLPNDHPSYLGNGSNNSGPFFQALFPAPPSTVAGSPGNIWTTLEIEVDNGAGVISFSLDGTLVYQGAFAGTFAGLTSLGINDTFTSVSGASNVFTLYDNFVVEEIADPIGTAYCATNVNSTGQSAILEATGSDVVAQNQVLLTASQLPLNQFAIFITSQTQGFFPTPGMPASQGNLCLGGAIGRYTGPGQTGNSGSTGVVALALDLGSTPTPTGPVAILAGETWNFQCWYRDFNPAGTSNFSNGVSILFQ